MSKVQNNLKKIVTSPKISALEWGSYILIKSCFISATGYKISIIDIFSSTLCIKLDDELPIDKWQKNKTSEIINNNIYYEIEPSAY